MKTMKKIIEYNCYQSVNYGSQNLALALLLTYHHLQLASRLHLTAKDNWEQRRLFWVVICLENNNKSSIILKVGGNGDGNDHQSLHSVRRNINLKGVEERIYGGKRQKRKKNGSKDEVLSLGKTPQDDFHFIFINFTVMNLKTALCNCQKFRVYVSF